MQTQFYLGCSGFYYKHWIGKFYPEGLAKKDWLNYYTQQFRTVEINNTFYRYPTKKLLNNWHQKTPGDFKFTLKANRTITHLHKFNQTKHQTQNFYKLAHLLKEKLLCVLFQLPPTVQKDMTLLQVAAEKMDTSLLNVFEFRHPSWWDNEVYHFLEGHDMVFCSVSASELPDDVVKTGNSVYMRFHGRDGGYTQNYSYKELEKWAQKIRRQNAGQVLCYFNNDYNANAPRNCLMLRELLEA